MLMAIKEEWKFLSAPAWVPDNGTLKREQRTSGAKEVLLHLRTRG